MGQRKASITSISEYQQTLESLNGYTGSIFSDAQWRFENVNLTFTADFSALENIENHFTAWRESSKKPIINCIKILFLEAVKKFGSINTYRYVFDNLLKTFYFLYENNILFISSKNINQYLEYLLLNGVLQGQPSPRIEPISYSILKKGLDIREWESIIRYNEMEWFGFSTAYSDTAIKKKLSSIIENYYGGDLTFRDWSQGGSHNTLTLDYGKYYIEHCNTFFNQHISLATALKSTIKNACHISTKAQMTRNSREITGFVTPIIKSFLHGLTVDELPPGAIKKINRQLLIDLQCETHKEFSHHLIHLSAMQILLKGKTLKSLASSLLLKEPELYTESLKLMAIHYLNTKVPYSFSLPDPSPHLKHIKHTLPKNFNQKTFYALIHTTWQQLKKNAPTALPTNKFFTSIGIDLSSKSRKTKHLDHFVRMVESTGLTSFMALTGWRESEYGFSLNNIFIADNLDMLDQASTPLRYTVNWVVPKTSGQTKLNREITAQTFFIADNLNRLIGNNSKKPCLYSYTSNPKQPEYSGDYVDYKIQRPWAHFLNHYQPFKYLDLIQEKSTLNKINQRTASQKTKLKAINRSIKDFGENNYEQDPILIIAHQRSRDEYDRVIFYFDHISRRKTVQRILNKELSAAHQVIIDHYLSADTLNKLQQYQGKKTIPAHITKSVIAEIMEGCLYPTPHAIRHLWAEAVYRRYDKDAGWFIRSTFKHISQQMWLSYIRDKANTLQHKRIKRQVISSLMNNYIYHKGEGYSGGLEKWVRRLLKATHLSSIEELKNYVTQLTDREIEDVKSTPWGFCILRKRNKAKAKCAIKGVPQRQNACPALCLGCNNNFILDSNIAGILLGISSALNALKADIPIAALKQEALSTVKLALTHLKRLKADQEIIANITTILNSHIIATD